MSGDRNKKNESVRKHEDRTEELARKAMLRRGWVIPTTPEEVAALEKELDEQAVDLPASLEDPYAVLDGRVKQPSSVPRLPANDDICQSLARAAREGKEISPEVEDEMRKDRRNAESEPPDGPS